MGKVIDWQMAKSGSKPTSLIAELRFLTLNQVCLPLSFCGCLLGWLLLASLRRRLTASSDWWAAAQRVQAVGREALWACVPVCEAVCLCEVWGA